MELRNNRRLLGKRVSGEEIPVIDEVWRTVEVGGLAFKDQRFIVVKTMICPIILGIDFWSRLRVVYVTPNELILKFKTNKNGSFPDRSV